MTDAVEMNETIRATLEDFGVVKPPKLPKLDVLVNEIRKRGGTVQFNYTDRGCTAQVGLSGNTFDAFHDSPGRAVAQAFSQALLAEPQQTQLFGGDGTLTDEAKARLDELKKKRQNDQQTDPKDGADEG